MQHQEQSQIGNIGTKDELMARKKRFAVVLCGDDQLAQQLVERLKLFEGDASGNNVSSAAVQFYQLKKLYELWMDEARKTSEIPLIFRPGHENEAIQKGLDPSIAKVMGGLPTLHRALLLLVYGEGFSYAATAQLLNITIEELMMALAGARQKFSHGDTSAMPAGPRQNAASENKVGHDTAQ